MSDFKRIADALEKIANEGITVNLTDLDFTLIQKIEDLVDAFNFIGSVAHPINVRVE